MPKISGGIAEFICNECNMTIGVVDAAFMRKLAALIKYSVELG